MIPPESTVREVFEYPEEMIQEPQSNFKQNIQVANYKGKGKWKGKKKKNVKKNDVYFKIKVAGKVAAFIEKMKAASVLNRPVFKKSELEYLTVEGVEKKLQKASINYESKILLVCQIWSYALFLMILWKATFEMVLGNLGTNKFLEGLGLFTCIAFGMLSINSEIKNEKMMLISQKEKIKELYIRNNFIPDLLTCFGLLLALTPFSETCQEIFYISRILLLVLIPRISDIFSKIENKLSVSKERQSAILIFKLILKILIYVHCISLVMIIISKLEHIDGVKVTWVEKSGFENVKNYELYIYAWYWICTIVSTVGFGDISPANPLQSAFVSILQIFSCVIFGYLINYIGSLLNIFGVEKAKFQQEIRRLNNYLHKLHVNNEIRDQARSFLFNKYKAVEVYDKIEEEEIHANLSPSISENLLYQNKLTLLENSKLKMLNEEILKEIAYNFQKTVLTSDQYLFTKDSQGIDLWVIEDGTIKEIPCKEFHSKPLSIYNEENSTIGWINFITDQFYRSLAYSEGISVVYKLERKFFLEAVKKFKNDFLDLCELKEKLIEKKKIFENKCLGCEKLSHNVMNCPRLHFVPKKIGFILNVEKERRKFNGENKRTYRNKRRKRAKKWFPDDLLPNIRATCESSKRNDLMRSFLGRNSVDGPAFFQTGQFDKSEKNIKSQFMNKKRERISRIIMNLSSDSSSSSPQNSITTYISTNQQSKKENLLKEIDWALSESEEKFRYENNYINVLRQYALEEGYEF